MAGLPAVALDPAAIRAQLERVLSSPLFLRAPFAQRFLRYIVEAELAGNAADIKEYRIGVDVFDRGTDFDPKTDTVVRVEGLRLRKRLAEYYAGEGLADPIVIEVPKGSYRVQAHFRTARESMAVPPVELKKSRHAGKLALAAVLVIATLSAFVVFRNTDAICSWVRGRPCEMIIAVLPFRAIGNEPANAALAEGLLYVLTGKLSAFEGTQALSVVPASDVVASGVTASLQARQRLGVNLILTGSVERGPSRTRITLSLTDARNQVQLKARTLDLDAKETASLQDQVLSAALGILDLELNPAVASSRIQPGLDPTAQNYFLQARGFLERGIPGADDAIALAQESISRDRGFAPAHALLAEAMLLKYRTEKDRVWIDRALEAAQTAKRLAPDEPETAVVLGILLGQTGKPQRALAEFTRALSLDPRHWRAQTELAQTLEVLGKSDTAEATHRKGIELRSNYWGSHTQLGSFLVRQGRFAEAEACFRRAVALAPENPEAIDFLGSAILWGGRPEEALPWLQKALLIRPQVSVLVALAEAHEMLFQYPEMVRDLERAVELAPKGLFPLYALGRAYRLAGLPDRARPVLERSERVLRDYLIVDPTRRDTRALWAMSLAEIGRHREALHEADRAIGGGDASALARRRALFVFAKCGQTNRALAVLRSLAGDKQEVALMRRDVDLAPVFNHPEVGPILGNR